MRYMTNKQTMGVRLTPELRKHLDEIANRTGIKVGTLIRMAVEEFLEEVEEKGELTFKLGKSVKGGSKPKQKCTSLDTNVNKSLAA